MQQSGFFDIHAKLTAKPAPAAPAQSSATAPKPLTVTQLTAQVDRVVKAGFPSALYVQGELSNYNHHRGSGHCYFTLKDATSCIDCVIWKSDVPRIKFVPANGMELIAHGSIKVYGAKGKYQLYVTSLQPVGQGALELAFRQLHAKLEAEGLFAAERKRPLPRFPRRVALVTSRQTAALQDMLKVLRRFAWVKLMLFHVPVQGDGAGQRIADALRCLSDGRVSAGGIDLVLLARGGGSLEDLWAFNEESVARAIAASRVPVVTGIGHEVDTSIADLVADYHAHTPTEAAQVAMQHWRPVKETIDTGGHRLRRGLRTMLHQARQRLVAVERHEVFRRPLDRVNSLRQLLDDRQRALLLGVTQHIRDQRRRVQELAERLEQHTPASVIARLREQIMHRERRLAYAANARLRKSSEAVGMMSAALEARDPRHALRLGGQRVSAAERRLGRAMRQSLRRERDHLDALQKQLNLIDPSHVLKRGYTITTLKRTGQTLRSAAQVKAGDRLLTRFAEGQAESTADDPKQPRLFE